MLAVDYPMFFVNPVYVFWITILAITAAVAAIAAVAWALSALRGGKCIAWDMHTEYIDISEFSNRNIPLRVTYRGTEPRWLWATYLSLRNTGRQDVRGEDTPERQHFIVGAVGCRYIGFNHLQSLKAKVTLSPLFKGDDVYCKIEFDRLGPGDEILASLLFVAEEKKEVQLEGALFGASSRIISGRRQRLLSWRGLWWLLIAVILLGTIGGVVFLRQSLAHGGVILYQFQLLVILYLLALATAGVLLRPIRRWEQIPERLHEPEPAGARFLKFLRFFFGVSEDL